MQGLMQDWPLTVDKIIDHAKAWHGDREIVTRSVEGPIVRTTYAGVHERAKRVSNALLALGVKPGDRVATIAWNTARHIEAWYGIMGIGAVCHTLNPRLHPDQLAYIINHAEDSVIFTDITFLPILAAIREKIPTVKTFVVMTDEEHMKDCPLEGAHGYETLVSQHSADCAWGGFDENTAAGLCYTSGTTGNPKGVLYSHRSNFLHTLVTMGADVLGVSATDVILPVVPMFHANAWGVAFSAPAVGAKLVMPGPKLDGASVHELLETEGVTFSAAVPTVWQMLLAHLRATGGKLTTLKRVVIGGSAVPESIVRGFKDEFGVEVTHAWGMTETSPLGTQATPNAAIAAMSAEDQLRYRLKQGRPPLTIELALVDEQNQPVPHDGETYGKLKVKGPFVVREYFKAEGGQILDGANFFDTGDVATIDQYGFMQITDRAKDVIKSGGEWISSIEIENLATGHPKAEIAAVIGAYHPKWDERPLLLVKLNPGETATKEEFLAYLEGKIAKWWTPDDVVFVDDIPLGATGKIDKKVLRDRFKDYVLPTAVGGGSAALAAAPAPKLYAPEPGEGSDDDGPRATPVWAPGLAAALHGAAAQQADPAPVVEAEPVEAPVSAGEVEDPLIAWAEGAAPAPPAPEPQAGPAAEPAAVAAPAATEPEPEPAPAPLAAITSAAPEPEPAAEAAGATAEPAEGPEPAAPVAAALAAAPLAWTPAPTPVVDSRLNPPEPTAQSFIAPPANDAAGPAPAPVEDEAGSAGRAEASAAAKSGAAAALEPDASGLTLVAPQFSPAAPAESDPHPALVFRSSDDTGDSIFARPLTPSRERTRERPFFRGLTSMALFIAMAPSILIGIGLMGTTLGWTTWRTGFGWPALQAAPTLAMAGVAVAALALLGSLADVKRLAPRALLALAIAGGTLGAFVWLRMAGVANPPLYEATFPYIGAYLGF